MLDHRTEPLAVSPAIEGRPISGLSCEEQVALTGWNWLPLAFGLALLWFILINQLRNAWGADPQYSYGFVVPVLAFGLLVRRWYAWGRDHGPQTTDHGKLMAASFAVCAFLILPLRLILEANPDWRLLNWLLTLETVTLTLALVYRVGGWNAVQWFAFPVAYILVAVPWPFTIERPVIQGLTRLNVAFIIEALGCVGVPAIQHGNAIEVGTGMVGVEDACSGIRSFQSSLMISLFFGEFYLMRRWRRLALVPTGFLLAIGFNFCRTTFLTLVAAKKGPAAIAEFHDQAGLTILLACTAMMWLIAWVLHRMQKAEGRRHHAQVSGAARISFGGVRQLSLRLFVWLLLVEVGVASWYRLHEPRGASVPVWTVFWPPPYQGFKELPISERVREILAYDEGHSGRWQTGDGATWTINYFRWKPGKQQAWLAGIHRPEVCMASLGHALRQQEKEIIRIGTLELPFQLYTYEEAGHPLYVFHCFWEQRRAGRNSNPIEPDKTQRLRAVLEGQRNLGQQTLQIALLGIQDKATATKALSRQLGSVIRAEPLR
jgi:exosortase